MRFIYTRGTEIEIEIGKGFLCTRLKIGYMRFTYTFGTNRIKQKRDLILEARLILTNTLPARLIKTN